MATLVLTAVGSAIGGPVGGAIGAIIGQQVDQNIIFRPKGREGPRLQELAIQTSSYGSQIPRIFGRMRVAGTVIWATDLKETRSREGGGKGRPSTTTYSYSACFAVALSSRRIRNIGRIWADGKIFRGVAGDFKTDTDFVFHSGGEDQAVDGLMASAEATGGTPAYRGIALAVFSDMDLTDYGNRIPSLTFEVIADDGSVMIADIVTDIADERIDLAAGDTIIGFAASGDDRHAALLTLTDPISLSYLSDPSIMGRMHAAPRFPADASAALIVNGDFVRTTGRQEFAPPENRSASVATVPKHMSVRYYDAARDYQAGLQSALRPGVGRISVVRDFPATMNADQARAMAANGLWSAYDERLTLHVTLPLGSGPYQPAQLVEFGTIDGLWRIRECEIGGGVAQLSLSSANSASNASQLVSEHGRNLPDPDLRAGLTRLVLVDLPFAIDTPTAPSGQSRLYAAAAGEAGWRTAQIFASGPDGVPGAFLGQIPAPGVIGVVSNTLAAANPALIDRISHIDVDMLNPDMELVHANDQQLLAGSNIAQIGREIVQFAEATYLGESRYRLSRLIRGLGGTEAEVPAHGFDEDFVLLDAGAMLEIGSSIYSAFTPTSIFALGRDDSVPVSATIESPGRALVPWSPVHPEWKFQDNGDLEMGWTRRSRAGIIWPDYVELPLIEEVEKYRLELSATEGVEVALTYQPTQPQITVNAADVDPFLAGSASSIHVNIRQIGAHGLSDPLVFEVPL